MSSIPSGPNVLSLFGINPLLLSGASADVLALIEASGKFADAAADYADEVARFTAGATNARTPACRCAPVPAPAPADAQQPQGSLRAEGNVITTAGGYKIEMLGQYEWKITGPDGKWTRIHGDPHVDEGDRDGSTDWDFKRNTTFVLGDGTRVNVTTVPGGAAGMTVTGSLEVISNNGESVRVTDIDKGKGVVGEVGRHSKDAFTGDTVYMGVDTDDWTSEGRLIVGSRDGGESFVLDDYVNVSDGRRNEEASRRVTSLYQDFFALWRTGGWQPNQFGSNPYNSYDRPVWQSDRPEDRRAWQDPARRMETMAEAFRALADMFQAMARFARLNDQLTAARLRGGHVQA